MSLTCGPVGREFLVKTQEGTGLPLSDCVCHSARQSRPLLRLGEIGHDPTLSTPLCVRPCLASLWLALPPWRDAALVERGRGAHLVDTLRDRFA